MKIAQFRCLLCFCLILMGNESQATGEVHIKATRVEPHPSYALTQDSADVAQLTDGNLVGHPIWKNRAAVGWAKATPLSIWLSLRASSPAKGTHSGRLRIHTVAHAKSGIHLPQRVDIYSSGANDSWTHIRGTQVKPAGDYDGKMSWLDFEVADASTELLVVIHASGEYFFVDEIAWEEMPLPPVTAKADVLNGSHQAIADSLARLKEVMKGNALADPQQIIEWTSSFKGSILVTWIEDPWSDLTGTPGVSRIRPGMNKTLQLVGVQDERESGCIGILNPSESRTTVTVSVQGSIAVQAALQLHKIEPVTAADGKTVYDALLPHGYYQGIPIPAHSASYLWVTADLALLPVGSHSATLEIRSTEGVTRDIAVTIQNVNLVVGDEQVPAVNWAYPSDKPIWAKPELAVQDLIRHGINVFVIPPSHIPIPSRRTDQTIRDFQALINIVRQYEGRGTYLLFLDWPPERLAARHIEWLHSNSGLTALERREALTKWLTLLSSAMEAAGVGRERWAIYPVDEYSGKHVGYLQDLFSILKSIAPAPRIYANPINTPSNPTRISDLKVLAGLVDLWQPEVSFAESPAREFFQSMNKGWGVYVVPPSPAKSVPPIFYRSLAWRAWRLGANGVGFWSYSDTHGSSAWDDLDGKMPDWAVVYEGEFPITSRRWEAFREGIEDLRLLQRAVAAGSQLPLQVRAQVSTDFRSTDISRFREGMLERP